MANKEWWETFDPLDCIHLWSWNEMTDYIQHSACTDFIIHSECTSTGQAFRFTQWGALSILEGGADSGDDLDIFANSTNTYPHIKLLGDGDINLYTKMKIKLFKSAAEFFDFERTGTLSQLYGGTGAGDNLNIYVNQSTACPRIEFDSAGDLTIKVEAASEFKVNTCADTELLVVSATELTYKGTNICLAPCAGVDYSCPTKGDLPFTLYDDCGAETGIGFQFTIAGALSTLSGGADSGDDLRILANSIDTCPMIELWGDAGIVSKIKADSIYEVSTCSDETLFEVDSDQADKHVDFHCLDAHNFCLECRTSDPSGPTCLGQMWFRTDLV